MLRPVTVTFGALILTLSSLAPVFAAAQSASALLDTLSATSYEAREEAARSLLQDDGVTLEALGELYTKARTAEQRHRLMGAIRHHAIRLLVEKEVEVMDQDTASIGVAPQALKPGALPNLDTPAILVRQTLPGFPGHAYLHAGDLIVSFQGQSLPSELSERAFVDLIQQYRPGESVVLGVLRGGKAIELSMPLGSGRGLAMIYAESGSQVAEPYRSRWLRLRQSIATGDLQAIIGFADRR